MILINNLALYLIISPLLICLSLIVKLIYVIMWYDIKTNIGIPLKFLSIYTEIFNLFPVL